MIDPKHLNDILWVLTTLMELVLLVYLVSKGLYRSHPAFLFYILAAILQSLVVAFIYRVWTYESPVAWRLAWGTQLLLTGARWAASFEIARRVFSGFSGIWG